jgi:glycerol-3-phosphate acyltransferase PlsY
MLETLIVLILSYLVGSIPTAIIAGKLLKKIDIRDHGSGNAGATNVLRVLGWKAALVVLLIDMLKGYAAVTWIVDIIPNVADIDTKAVFQIMAGAAAICGHIWTIFAGFKGGKGVGTAAGVFFGLQPVPVFICLLAFIGIVSRTKYVSLGSMIGALLLPTILVVQYFFLDKPVPIAHTIIAILLGVLIVILHRENIHRLVAGTENKISFKKGENS